MAFHFERKLDPCFFRHKAFYAISAVFQNFQKFSTCNLLKGHKLTILFHGSQFPLLMFLFTLGFCQSKFFSLLFFFPLPGPVFLLLSLHFFSVLLASRLLFLYPFFTFSHYFFGKKIFKLLLILFIYSSRPHHVVCKVLVPRSGMKPMPPALKAQSSNHWTAGEVPVSYTLLTIHNIELYFNINVHMHIYLIHAHRSLSNLKLYHMSKNYC